MNTAKISNQELDQILKRAVAKERELLSEILFHIIEVDRRKLYLTFAYSSLFDYLTKHIGYSADSAQRRIDAARLSKEIPEVISRLESGSLNLAQVGLLQKSVRQSQSENKCKITIQDKKKIVEQMCGKSFNESQVLVSQSLNLPTLELPKITHQQNESVRLELTLTKTQWLKLNEMRELLSNSLPSGSWDQVLEYVSDKVIAQKSTKVQKTMHAEAMATEAKKEETDEDQKKKNKPDKPHKENEELKLKQNRLYAFKARVPLTKNLRDQVFARDQCCQYQDKHTGKICGPRWKLHVDHVRPIWAEGSNEVGNLRLLCANHNLEIYRQQAGIYRY